MNENDIVFENNKAWIHDDKQQARFTVYRTGSVASTSDASFSRDVSGLSLAVCRAQYIETQKTDTAMATTFAENFFTRTQKQAPRATDATPRRTPGMR